jgi:hypothetical protein
MREKLAQQQAKGLTGRELYTSYANLGTFLIHGSFRQASSGDREAKERFLEGVEFIRKSVEVNPEAHFGREQWQASIAEFLLASMDRLELLKTHDCIGNRLDLGIEEILNREQNWVYTGYGRPYDAAFAQGKVDDELPKFFAPGVDVEAPDAWPEMSPIRRHITKVGAEAGWDEVDVPSHRAPVPFDEPVLGIIGMWRQGGGANPHFALALGETMLRAGQRFIAWDAYERASRLADRYSPDPKIQDDLRKHCLRRQAEIEGSLGATPESLALLRKKFNDELAYGEAYQKAYQDFEAAKIAKGVRIDDPDFFDDFNSSHESIASRSGSEESLYRVPRSALYAYTRKHRDSWALFGAGLAAFTTASVLSLRSRKRAATGTSKDLHSTESHDWQSSY